MRSFLLFMLALSLVTLPLAYEAGRVQAVMERQFNQK